MRLTRTPLAQGLALLLSLLYWSGLKKEAVQIANFMLLHAPTYKTTQVAYNYLLSGNTGFPKCERCTFPVVSTTERAHSECRRQLQRFAEQAA